MLSDAELYSEHRSMQVRDTDIFLPSVVSRMDWSRQDRDVVMDIGCGPGDSSRKMFLSAFPYARRVIGVDVLEEMIEHARKNNSHERMEYHVADLEDSDAFAKWSGQISKVISIYCLHWLGDQAEAFRTIYNLLRPGGEAALLFVLTTPFWDSYQLHYDNPKWSKYLEGKRSHVPESHSGRLGASFYRDLLLGMGFEVVICEAEERQFDYPSDENCRAACYSRSALTAHVPDALRREFKEDLFRGFLLHNGRNAEGMPRLQYTTLTLLLRKPDS